MQVMAGTAMAHVSVWIIITVLLFSPCWLMYTVLLRFNKVSEADYQLVLKRMLRHAEFQERIIGADGSFPPFGRSITYRTGALRMLTAQTALMRRARVPRSASSAGRRSAGGGREASWGPRWVGPVEQFSQSHCTP